MWLVVAVSLILLSIFIVGSFVWLRGSRSKVNVSFAIFSYAITFWMLSNFLGANFKDQVFSLYATKADFILGAILAFATWYFTAALLREADTRRSHPSWYDRSATIIVGTLCSMAAIVTLSPQVIEVVKPRGQELIVTYGNYYPVFATALAVVVSAVVLNLYFARRLARGRLRQQVSVMLAALLLSALLVGFANLVLPQLSSSPDINLVGGNLSYVGVAFFVIATFYSIAKHRLFDLRLVLARSIAYLLLVAVLAVLYGVLTLVMTNTLVTDYELSGRTVVVPLISIVFLTFTVGPLNKFLNKLTNRIFYKDSYEPQQFLGELNQTIISNVDIEVLLQSVGQTLEKYLKVFFAVFELQDSKHSRPRIIGNTTSFDRGAVKGLQPLLDAHKGSMVVTDELTHEYDHLKAALEDRNIAVVSSLSTLHGQRVGYLLLANKKNGESYTSKDLEVIGIASGELVIAIQNALRFEEIENFNATLQEKIEEATKRLRQTNAKLRMLDETKDDFISMASHQLRTPLTSVKGYVSMVLDGDAGKITPLQRKLLNQSFVSSQRMVYLISDLLNLSRLRTGKFIIEATPCNLADIIKGEIEQLKETAKGRNLELTYQKPEHFPTYMLDETKLRQVIMNFVDNAIYYTPSGGHITVNLVEKPETIEFTVVDNGIGVPKHEQHHLFSKFYRANNAKRARPDGTGLGLFMAKKVVIAQGGAIIFKSQEGKGSTFGFSFAKDKLQTPTK
jgi:signal transduction histidine kinase